jgi:hypothetical protein
VTFDLAGDVFGFCLAILGYELALVGKVTWLVCVSFAQGCPSCQLRKLGGLFSIAFPAKRRL